jgi:hypothetical protein
VGGDRETHRTDRRVFRNGRLALSQCLVYLAASGDRLRAEKLLKERRRSLDYVPEVSVVTQLVPKLFGVGEGTRQVEVVDAFKLRISSECRPY